MSTLAGHLVTSFALTTPRLGCWSAEAACEADTALSGAVDLVIEGRTWRGTVVRGGVEQGRWSGKVVGAAGLHTELAPQAFRSTTLAAVFSETLRAAGCTSAATLGELTAAVVHWHRHRAPGARTVAQIADAAGYGWRALADGTVWTGPETWAALALPAGVELLEGVDHGLGRYPLAGDGALDLLPGRTVTLDGTAVRVGLIEHQQHGAALRTVVWSERETEVGGRLRAALVSIIRSELRALPFLRSYPSTVVRQNADGTLDLRPDDPTAPPPPAVKYRTLRGFSLTVAAGARVLLEYEGGDPRRPIATLWEAGDATAIKLNGGTHRAAREGDDVSRSVDMATWMNAVSTFCGIVSSPSVLGTVDEGSDALRLP